MKPLEFVVERSLWLGSRRLIPVTRSLVKSNPQHCTLQHKKGCGIKLGPDQFGLVSMLGRGSS